MSWYFISIIHFIVFIDNFHFHNRNKQCLIYLSKDLTAFIIHQSWSILLVTNCFYKYLVMSPKSMIGNSSYSIQRVHLKFPE